MRSPAGTLAPAYAGHPKYVWYRELTGYQWFALSTAALGWMFDCMAQQLFSIARKPAVHDLLGRGATDAAVSEQAGYSTMILMIGWATSAEWAICWAIRAGGGTRSSACCWP